jgi:hypothetical protein
VLQPKWYKFISFAKNKHYSQSFYFVATRPSNIREGSCDDDSFAEVVTGSHKGPVGLVEPCPEIYLGAINVVKKK